MRPRNPLPSTRRSPVSAWGSADCRCIRCRRVVCALGVWTPRECQPPVWVAVYPRPCPAPIALPQLSFPRKENGEEADPEEVQEGREEGRRPPQEGQALVQVLHLQGGEGPEGQVQDVEEGDGHRELVRGGPLRQGAKTPRAALGDCCFAPSLWLGPLRFAPTGSPARLAAWPSTPAPRRCPPRACRRPAASRELRAPAAARHFLPGSDPSAPRPEVPQLPGELAKHAMSEGAKAVARAAA